MPHISPIFQEVTFRARKIKNKARFGRITYIFSKKAFLIFGKTEPSYAFSENVFLIFRKTEHSYIFSKKTFPLFWKTKTQKTHYISGSNFPSLKKDLHSSPKLKKTLILGGTSKA